MHDSESNGKKSIQEMETLRQHKLKTERLRRKDSWQKKIQPTIGVDKPQAARRTGIDVLGDVPWGTHLCVFYQDKQDLIDILVPYFKEGLENNEFCVWITSEPLNAKDAEQSLRQAVNNLDDYIEKGQIEILDYNQWYTKSGSFDADKVIQGWMEKYEQAGKRKFDGLRVTGNTFWLQKKDWRQFAEYERTIDEIVHKHHMLTICTYCLEACRAAQIVDVVSSHKYTIIKRQGKWELVENSELKNTNRALQNALKQWETTFNTTQDSIMLIDPDFRIIKANSATSNLLGKPLNDILGSKCYELIHGTNQAPDICPHKRAKKTKKHEEAELYIPDKDIWIAISVDPILDDNGNINGTVHVARNITESKRAEKALKTSELRFRSLIEQTTDAVFCYEYDPPIPTDLPTGEQVKLLYNGILVECNDVCAKSYGAQRVEEVIGSRLKELFRTTSGSLDKLFTTLIEGDYRIVDGESVEKLEDGLERYYLNNSHGIIEDGKIIRVWGTFRDITERKKIEMALRESEQRYRAIFEQAADSIVLIDAETGELVEFNDRTHQNLGYTREEFQNLKIPDFEVIESTEEVKKHLEKIVRTGTDTFETKHRTKDDEIRDVQIRSRAISIREKDFVQSIWRDITDSKKAEAALIESEEKFRNLAEQSPNMIFINRQGRVVYANKKCKEVMGYKREELYNPDFDFMTLIAPEFRQLIKTNLGRHMKGEEIKPYEYGLVTKEGERLEAIITTKLMKYNGEDAILGTITDITERKQAEEKLREYQEQLKSLASELTLAEERERHRIATELHDEISQSLFISKMKLEEIQKSGSGKTFDDTLDEINNSLGRIIASMRSLTFDLSSPILYEFGFEEAVAEWLNERVGKKYGIATEFEDDGLPKPLDDDIRVILFRNVRELLINVVKHAHAKKIKVSIKKVDSRIRICVEDDGLGFDSAKAESMITNKKTFGLFSIRERLEHFGGNLEIESESGCGCRITITSPLRQKDISEDKQA
jgi:PAS domain S-box-containing protein